MLYTIIFNPDYFHSLYNCSFYKVDDLPLEKRRHVGHGIILLTCGVLFQVSSMPCDLNLAKGVGITLFYREIDALVFLETPNDNMLEL